MACSTPGHEEKAEHGRSGLCQACYRRQRRRELDPAVGTRKPGPKPLPRPPDAPRPHRARAPEERVRVVATDTHCANGHPWTPETTYFPANGQKKVCRICQRQANQRHHGREVTDDPMAPRNADKTHCAKGHAYSESNTWRRKDGSRACRTCQRYSRIFSTYGLDANEFDDLVLVQEGRCDTCSYDGGDLHVDHDHATGEVRALLCSPCNRTLGLVREDVGTLRRLADYIEKHRDRGSI